MSDRTSRPGRQIQFAWILSPGKDLAYYIGSVLAGWLYLGVILYAIWVLENPLQDALGVLTIGGLTIPLTLELLVVVSWALVLDAPHVWATLARTLFDPDEWRVRGREIRTSFLFFFLGPALILGPYLVGAAGAKFGTSFSAATLAAGAVGFFLFFRLWAYYHVVRQHWGFFRLYKRKAGDLSGFGDRLDTVFFNSALYLPLVMFMSSSFYTDIPGNPDLGMRTPFLGQISLGEIVYPLSWAAFLAILVVYLGYQAGIWWRGDTINGSKLLYLLPLVPLHLAVFSHPILVVFVVPLVTVGHNIQYHAIVYSYAQNKYPRKQQSEYRWARALFKNFGAYAFFGLLFTFFAYRGPLIEWLQAATGGRLDQVAFNALGMMAGIRNPADLALGQRVLAAVFVGFAMQHYYLDSKIWRVGTDSEVKKHLKV